MNARSVAVFLVAVVVAGITARLGAWQMDRAAQKEALQDAIDKRAGMAALSADELAREQGQVEAQRHRTVSVEGAWLPAHTIYLDNRQMQGRPGFFVVTPLALTDGTAVLVQRGWLPRDPLDRTRIQAPVPPEGTARVVGRIAGPPARLYELGGVDAGVIRQNVDMEAYGRERGIRLRPVSILQTQAQANEMPGLLREWTAPATGVHKHHGYAFQWFALSALTILLYLWFQILRPWRRGRLTS